MVATKTANQLQNTLKNAGWDSCKTKAKFDIDTPDKSFIDFCNGGQNIVIHVAGNNYMTSWQHPSWAKTIQQR